MLFAGGGIQTGQLIGATDARGEDPIDRRIAASELGRSAHEIIRPRRWRRLVNSRLRLAFGSEAGNEKRPRP